MNKDDEQFHTRYYSEPSFTRFSIDPFTGRRFDSTRIGTDQTLHRKIIIRPEAPSAVDPKKLDNRKRGAHKFQGKAIPKNMANQPRYSKR